MNKKVLSYLTSILIVVTIFMIDIPKDVSAQVTEEWVAIYNGPDDGKDFPNTIAIDSSGNIYVTGWSWANDTYFDFLTVAYDPSGNEIWNARYDGPVSSYDYPYDIELDESGNIYVTGKSSVVVGSKDEEHMDFTTVSYDSSGNQRWVAQYNGPGNGRDIARGMSLDQYGNVYVVGESRGSNSEVDYTTIAYDSDGNQLWIKRYDGLGNNDDYANAITVDPFGIVYVTGYSLGIGTDKDYATVAYDLSGNELWVARYDGPVNDDDEAVAIALGPSGNIYVTGCSDGGNTYYGMDYATVAYDPLGNQLWVARTEFTGRSFDFARDIAVDSTGNVYVTGGAGAGQYHEYDYLTVAYDYNGNQLWMARYNGPINHYDYAIAIAVDHEGNIYVTGDTKSDINNYDYLTIAYDSEGNEIWVAGYDGPHQSGEHTRDIAVDANGNIYVTGNSHDVGINIDYLTIKYSRPIIQSNIDIDPDTLNLKSKGRWITCYIDLPEGYDVNEIDISTVLLEDAIPAEWGDVQGTTLMVKFDRSEVEDYIGTPQDAIELRVTGEFFEGTQFEGSDTIRVICPP